MLETYREDLVVKNRSAERLATIGQFAAGIGHELRNPLGVIESSLFLLRQHLGPERGSLPNVAKHLDRIGGEVVRANKTIHDLLDLARNRPPRRHPTDLRRVGRERGCDGSSSTDGPGHDGDRCPTTWPFTWIPTRFNRCWSTSSPTRPRRCLGAAASKSPRRPCLPTGAACAVRDDGPGIPAEVRHRVFEALFTTKAKGSGLGLALCRRIVEAHGGSIDLDPERDRRCSFVLVLPSTPIAANMIA